MDTIDKINQSRDNLMSSLKSVIQDAEKVLENTSQQAGEGYKTAKAKLESTIADAKWELERLEDAVISKTKEAADATDRYVRDNPWQAVGIGAGIGILIGILIGRR